MKDFYVRDAAAFENKVILSSFVVASKQTKAKKSGEPYLALTLADRTGQIEAKMWDNVNEVTGDFEQDDFVKVKGLLNKYNGRFQLTIHKLRRLADSEVDFSDYLPKTAKDVEELWRTLGEFVASLRDENLKALLRAFMDDPEIAAAYKSAPAAKTLHHAFIGGLLDHVVSLFRICDLVCGNYPHINRDLVLTGAFLHDIGKIYELSYARSFSYTTRGQLLGHMIIELEMLQRKIAQLPGFPEAHKTLIEHMIISHHGQYEFGSPKLPMFPEALLLHYLDDLDSKMEAMRAQLERESANDGDWAGWNASLGRTLLDSAKFLAGEKPAPPEASPETPATPQSEEKPAEAAAAAAADNGGDPRTGSYVNLAELQAKFGKK